ARLAIVPAFHFSGNQPWFQARRRRKRLEKCTLGGRDENGLGRRAEILQRLARLLLRQIVSCQIPGTRRLFAQPQTPQQRQASAEARSTVGQRRAFARAVATAARRNR